MTLTPVAIADPPLRSSYGLHAPYALRTIVELRSEDGVCGAAEAHGGEKALADFERVRPVVVGADAYGLTRLADDVQRIFVGARSSGSNGAQADRSQTHFVPGENPYDVPLRIYAALEVACLDLIGRAHGMPVCDLLGGRVRDAIPFAAYLFYKHAGGGGEASDARDDEYGEALSPEGIVAQAKAMTAKYGFASYKLKGGVLAPEVEAETILALRAAFGPAPQRIDPNSAWSHETALGVARRLYGAVEYLEDPVAGLDGMGRLHDAMRARGVPIPLASNVAVTHFGDLPESVRRHAVQIVLGDHHYWGGPRAIGQLGRLCETFGLGLSMHSNSHLGLSLAAMAHVAAATPQLTFACDTHYPWQSADDEIVEGGRIPIAGGCVRVPTGPGLGVTLDRDQLARGRERYANVPYRKRDDTAEMRKHVDPQWSRLLPAW